MRIWLALKLRQLAAWLDPPSGPLAIRTRVLIHEAEQRLGAGFGEAKRHQVYAQLIKEFPALSKRHLSLAIEHALTGVIS